LALTTELAVAKEQAEEQVLLHKQKLMAKAEDLVCCKELTQAKTAVRPDLAMASANCGEVSEITMYRLEQ